MTKTNVPFLNIATITFGKYQLTVIAALGDVTLKIPPKIPLILSLFYQACLFVSVFFLGW